MDPTGRRRVVILGATGSIGRQALDVIRAHPELFEVIGLVAGRDREGLARTAAELGVRHTGLGSDAAVEIASLDDADIVLNAVVGAAGLKASIAALVAGKVLALANKESLVAGGDACLAAADAGDGRIVAVDSEHAAIAQCLEGRDRSTVARVVLTASGGPFRNRADLSEVTPEEALAHPTWSMGPKITVDSATMMNKGLEVIEAHHLFGFAYDQIAVVIHPQSIVHGIVELIDGSVMMQAAPTDMRLPIQAALTAPERHASPAAPFETTRLGVLEFEELDPVRFPTVALAYESGRKGMSYPAVLNAANEEAVQAFLAGSIAFVDIARVIEAVLSSHDPVEGRDVDEIIEVDAWARSEARAVMAKQSAPIGSG